MRNVVSALPENKKYTELIFGSSGVVFTRNCSMETVVKWAKKLKEPHEIWVKAYLQQQVDDANLKLRIDVKAVS